MVVVNNAAVRAYGNINACLFKILVPSRANLDKGCSLTSAYTLGLAGNADRAAADTHLYKVSSRLG